MAIAIMPRPMALLRLALAGLPLACPGMASATVLSSKTDGIGMEAFRFQEGKDPSSFHVDGLPGDLAARVTGSGFDVQAGSTSLPQRFQVLGIGRAEGPMRTWSAGAAQCNGNEVYYPGEAMGVHYQVSAIGLRQSFLVFAPPSGRGDLRVRIALSNELIARSSGPDGARFFDPEGRAVFDYKGLRCWDALQAPLNARIEISRTAAGQELHIVVDDANARYPITIDPVSTSPSTLLVGTQAAAEFGIAVATAGDLNGDGRSDVVVGAWQATMGGLNLAGAAYVYYGTNTGISTVASVTLTSGQQGAQFGNAVSTAGDVNGDGFSDLLVGSRTWESNISTDLSEGAVFVYHGSSTGISTIPDLILQPDHPDDNFGSNVACAGDINDDGYSDVLVGAYLSSYPTLNEGAVFVYLGGATGLNPAPQHRLERNQGGAFFGRSLAGAGDVNGDGFSDVIIGSSKYVYTLGASDQGSAFVYYGSAGALGPGLNPAPGLQLFGSGNNVGYYGWWVSTAGDLNGDGYSDVAVTAYNDNIGGELQEGLVYVYHGAGSGLNNVPAVVLQSNQPGAWMGRSVSSAGDANGDGYADLLVGLPKYANPENLEGVVQMYLGSATGIPATASFTFELNNAGANFGESVCPAGDVNGDGYSDIIAGARIYGLGGAAAVFHGGPYGTHLLPSATRFGGAGNARLGSSIANAGDVNGDGYADMITGAPGASNGQAGEGLVYVHYGSATGLSIAPSLTLEANVAGAQFGASVASAGDVNGDGYADVIVGAPQNSNGAAYIHLGSPAGLSTIPSSTLTGGLQFGSSVATAGDVNHDGYAEVIIGAPGSDQASVFQGSAAGSMSPPLNVLSEGSGMSYGCSVATAGDVNGDGYSDVIVGARQYGNGQVGEGGAYVYHGSITGVITPYARLVEVDQVNANFGCSVAGAGDVNGDGYFDVVVGADLWESGQLDEGAAFIYHGSPAGIPAAAALTLQRNVADARFGRSVAEGGDVNGDGYADIVVGAPQAENSALTTNEGISYVFKGSVTGIQATGFDQLEANVSGYQHGASVSGGGDVDGDGYSDVLVGAPYANPALANEGGHYWYRGAVNRALNRLSRQYDADLVTPMSTNSTDPMNSMFFGIGHRARSPVQRCRARLHWEVVFEGMPYSNVPITNSVMQSGIGATWTMLPLAGVEIKQLIGKTVGSMRHKWRVRVEYETTKLINGQRFSRWFYGYASGIGDIGVLPVELLSFTGRAVGQANELSWTTATEHHSDRFELMRSTDASSFTSIASVPAAGESQGLLAYGHTDPFPPRATAYYQLQMVDQDGASELSDVIAIARGTGIGALFPNPAADHTQVVLGERPAGSSLVLIDAEGRVMHQQPLLTEGLINLDVSGLAAGTYSVLLRDPQGAVLSALPLIKR